MARIAIPEAVYLRSRQEKRGTKQAAVLREYLADKIPNGHEIADYERDRVTKVLMAVTAPVPAADPDVPAKFQRKPRRG